MESIDELQKKLAIQVEAAEKQSREEEAVFAKKAAENAVLIEAERTRKQAEIRAIEERHAEKKRKALEEEARLIQEENAKRQQLESDINAAEEKKKAYQDKKEWLDAEATKNEVLREYHRKTLADAALIAAQPIPEVESSVINVEHPVAPVSTEEPGGAVDGTGGLEVGPDMSDHMRQILRQSNRE